MSATSKLVKAWESKTNQRAMKAGGGLTMALTLAACGGSSDTTTTTPVVETPVEVPAVDAAKSFTLTTATDSGASFTGGSGNDTFSATNLTLGTTDEIDGGAGTGDILTVVNTADEAYTLAVAKIDNIETVNITNQSGSAAADGSAEVTTVVVGAMQAGQYITIGDKTYLATADKTAAEVATDLIAGTTYDPTGYTLEQTASDTITATATTVGNKVDLAVGGNVFDAVNQVSTVTISGSTIATSETHSIVVNGVSIAVASVGSENSTADLAANTASAINGYIGTNVATAVGSVVVVNSSDAINIGSLTPSAGDAAATTALANGKQTLAVTLSGTWAANDSVQFTMNGEAVDTGAIADEAATVGTFDQADVELAVAAAINTKYGAEIATISGGNIVVDSGDVGIYFGGFAVTTAGNGTASWATSSATASGGLTATDAPVATTVDGVAAVSAATYAVTADASKIDDATLLASVNSTADVSFSNMVATQAAKVVGNTVLTNGNSTFGYKATVTSASVAIEDGTTAGDITLTGAGLTSAALTSAGEKNTVGTIDVAGAKTVTVDASTNLTATAISTTGTAGTLTITGAGAVKLGTLDAGFDTVTAAGNSGGLTAVIGAETDTVLTGSSGNDKITASTTDSIASSAKLAVNAGAGTDTLVIGDANDVNSAADGARYTGFEALDVSASQDMSLIAGIESVAITGDTITLSKMTATQAANVSADATADALTMTLETASGTSDVASITAKSATATTNVSLTDLAVDNFETANVAFTTGTAGTQSALDFAANKADELTALNITGSADVKLTVDANVMDVKAVTIDASALTGKFEIADNSGTLKSGSKVIGSSQDDTIDVDDTTGTSYEGGAGKDAFAVEVATLNATGTNDTSLDGGAGVDTMTFNDTGDITITDGYFTNVSSMEKLTLSSTGDQSLTMGTNFANAFSSVTVTTATAADAKSITIAGGLYDGDTTIVATSAGVGNATGENHSIVTGDGADTITLTASSFVGAASGSTITIDSGAGNDKITLKVGTLANDSDNQAITIDAGAGKDTIDLTKTNGTGADHFGNAKIVIEAGDSLTTSYDVIKGFDDGAVATNSLSDTIDFDGTSAVSDFTQSNDFGVIKSHALSNGVATFDDVDTFDTALVIDADNLADVIGYLVENTATLDTVAFLFDSTGDGSNDATMVYNNNTVDSLVLLDGLSGTTSLVFEDTSTDAAVSII